MTVKLKTAHLEGYALNWAVATAKNYKPIWDDISEDFYLPECDSHQNTHLKQYSVNDWPMLDLIKEEGISLRQSAFAGKVIWDAAKSVSPQPAEFVFSDASWFGTSEDPSVAVKRCFVEFKLGKTVDVPNELVKMVPDLIPTTWAVSNKSYYGEIIGMKDPDHIVQSIGRSAYISHAISNLSRIPEKGETLKISYDEKRIGQVGGVVKEQEKGVGR